MRKLLGIGFLLGILVVKSWSQDYHLPVNAITEKISLDGKLNEQAWHKAPLIGDFQMNQPYDSLPASLPTEVRVLQDDKFLYIAATCHSIPEEEFIIQSLKRDFDLWRNESFAIFLDAFSDANSGLTFAVNAFGVQMDAIIPRGGTRGLSESWDALWEAEVFRDKSKGYWSVEIAIPLKTLRFKKGEKTWRVNFARIDMQKNQYSTWVPIPRGFNTYTLSYMGELQWKQAPKKQGNHVVAVPYSGIRLNQDHQATSPFTLLKPTIGLDAKIAITSSLNLDLTVNPDFSQVEVDEQVIDLNRFEISFPEKRILFLENSDLFAGLGNSRVSPFFSRRIGSLENNLVPIKMGLRLSGKLDKDWRIGLMSVQTGAPETIDFRSQNYGVAAIERKVGTNSSVVGFLTNRQSVGSEQQSIDLPNSITNQYNRIIGLEYNYRSNDSKWDGKAFIHKAFSPDQQNPSIALTGKMRYRTRVFTLFAGFDAVSEDYQSDMGFVPRLYHENPVEDSLYRIPYIQFRSNGEYRFYPKSKHSKVAYYGPGFGANLYTGNNFEYQEHDLCFNFFIQWLNSSKLSLSLNDFAPKLFFPFQLSGMDVPFMADNYPGRSIQIDYASDNRQMINTKVSIGYGGEYLGRILNFNGELNFRKQPWGTLGVNLNYRNLSQFSGSYNNPDFTLIGSKIELSFSRNLFFTTYVQYNTQRDNFNINSRFQWRFKPMSDLFLVYTENYTALDFMQKNRAVVLKVNYWLNL